MQRPICPNCGRNYTTRIRLKTKQLVCQCGFVSEGEYLEVPEKLLKDTKKKVNKWIDEQKNA